MSSQNHFQSLHTAWPHRNIISTHSTLHILTATSFPITPHCTSSQNHFHSLHTARPHLEHHFQSLHTARPHRNIISNHSSLHVLTEISFPLTPHCMFITETFPLTPHCTSSQKHHFHSLHTGRPYRNISTHSTLHIRIETSFQLTLHCMSSQNTFPLTPHCMSSQKHFHSRHTARPHRNIISTHSTLHVLIETFPLTPHCMSSQNTFPLTPHRMSSQKHFHSLHTARPHRNISTHSTLHVLTETFPLIPHCMSSQKHFHSLHTACPHRNISTHSTLHVLTETSFPLTPHCTSA